EPGAQIRAREGARHAPRHSGRHGRSLRARPDARGDARRARRQARGLRLPSGSHGEAVNRVQCCACKEKENAMKQTYSGGCQCGAVKYDVSMELGDVIACNCSRCGRLGSLLAFAPAADFTLKSGEGAMT